MFFNKNDVYKPIVLEKIYGTSGQMRLVYLKSSRAPGFEEIEKKSLIKSSKEEVFEKSISRTKRNIRELVLCNNFHYFSTWTVSSVHSNRFALDDIVHLMKKLLKAYKRKYSEFQYLYIIEKHENGAFHFHGFVNDIYDKIQFTSADYDLSFGNKLPYKLIEQLKKGKAIYHSSFFDDKLGFNTFSPIDNINKSANYCLKYIQKDPVKTSENQIYFCSRGLKKADTKELDISILNNKEIWLNCHSNEFCMVKDFYFEELTRDSKIDLTFM